MEPNGQSADPCNHCKIGREEYEILVAKNRELLQTTVEQAQQLHELHKQLEIECLQVKKLQKDKLERFEYFSPQFEFLLEENKQHSNELLRSNRSPNLDPSSQTIQYSSFTWGGASNDEDENRLEKFLSADKKFNVDTKPEILLGKLEVVKGFVLRDRAKKNELVRSIVEEAKRKESLLMEDIKEQEERLKSTIQQFESSKSLFTKISENLTLQINSLKADLEQEKMENLRLHNAYQTALKIKTFSYSADVHDSEESTLSTGIAGDYNGADTASVITRVYSSSVADSSNSKTFTSSPNSKQRRQENLSDGEEISKKLKSSIDLLDFASRDDISSNCELQQALNKINVNEKGSNEIDRIPNTGMNHAAPSSKTEDKVTRSPPVLPITREEARIFFSVKENQFATFSEMHYLNASRRSSYLLNRPIGFDNPGQNFCYMNSVLQALACIPSFAVNVVCGVDSEEGTLFDALYLTFRHLWVRRPDAWNNNRPSILNPEEIRSYYALYRRAKFDPRRQHDAQEFLEDLISNLESEMSYKCGGVEEENLVTNLFRGYIVAPDGTREYFRNLRLSIEDERINSVMDALVYHLLSWSPRAVPLDMTGTANSSSTANVAPDENFIYENIDDRSQVESEKNELVQVTSSTGEINLYPIPNVTSIDHNAKLTSIESTETTSTCDETVDCDSHLNAGSSLGEFSLYDLVTQRAIKIYTPDILCISLNRYKIDYSYNYKVLPPENLVIPADLLAPEGMTMPAHYKLMSIVQYIRAGTSAGHYFTLLNTGKGDAYVLNDDLITSVEMNDHALSAFDSRSIIFIYARVPENL